MPDLALRPERGRPSLARVSDLARRFGFRGVPVSTPTVSRHGGGNEPGDYPHDIATAGQAADVVRLIVEGLRKAHAELQPRGTVHLFLVVPAGLAMMIGQALNTFGPVQTYEHLATNAVGMYRPAVLLSPSA